MTALSFAPTHATAQQRLDAGAPPMTTRMALRIAAPANGAWEFSRIRDLEVDSRGQMYALDDAEKYIRVFSPNGVMLRTIGRIGSGPGEFRHPTDLQAIGDTLWVRDNQNGRLTAFSFSTGRLLRPARSTTVAITHLAVSPTGVFHVVSSSDDVPSLKKPVTVVITHQAANASKSTPIARLAMTGGSLRIRTYKRDAGAFAAQKPGGIMYGKQPFSYSPLYQVQSGGRSLVLIDRESGQAGRTINPFGAGKTESSFRVIELNIKGDTVVNRLYLTTGRSVTTSDVRAVVDSMAQIINFVAPNKGFVLNPAEIRDSLELPKVWPPVTEFFAGSDGVLWLRQPAPPGPVTNFWRIAADGSVLPAVTVKAGLRIMRVTTNKFWAVSEDADFVNIIEVHEVVPVRK